MKCQTCGKEFETYNRVCPYCHSKRTAVDIQAATVEYAPIVKPESPTPYTPRDPSRPAVARTSAHAGKDRGIMVKYALIGGFVLLAVLSAAVLVQSGPGGTTASPSTGIASVPTGEPVPSQTPIASIAQPKITYSGSAAGTLSPYGDNSGPVTPNPSARGSAGPEYRTTNDVTRPSATPAPRTAVVGTVGNSPVVSTTGQPLTRAIGTPQTTSHLNPVSSMPSPVTEKSSPAPNTPGSDTIVPDPGLSTSNAPAPASADSNPPMILSVSAEKLAVDTGETVRFDVITASEIPLGIGHWAISTPVGGRYSTGYVEARPLGQNRWKFVVEERTSDYWPSGEVKLTEVDVSDEISLKSDTWSTPAIVQVTNKNYKPAVRPVIVLITPDRTEISAGDAAYFTVLVRSAVPVGHYGSEHYSYKSPVGRSYLNGGLDFQKIGDDSWQAKMDIETYSSWPSGDVVLTELQVNNAVEQSSDLWTTPVKIHVTGGSDVAADRPRILSVNPEQSEVTAGQSAHFTVTVQAHTQPGYPGFCYYQGSSPTGGYRLNGGMNFAKIGEDLWRTSLEVETTRYATGQVTITEVGVGNEAQLTSDPWRGSVTVKVVSS